MAEPPTDIPGMMAQANAHAEKMLGYTIQHGEQTSTNSAINSIASTDAQAKNNAAKAMAIH